MQMARELDAILDHGEASPANSCVGENKSVSFLEQIIRPIYDTIASVSPFYHIISHYSINFNPLLYLQLLFKLWIILDKNCDCMP